MIPFIISLDQCHLNLTRDECRPVETSTEMSLEYYAMLCPALEKEVKKHPGKKIRLLYIDMNSNMCSEQTWGIQTTHRPPYQDPLNLPKKPFHSMPSNPNRNPNVPVTSKKIPLSSPNNSLQAQPLQKPTEILLADLNDTGLK